MNKKLFPIEKWKSEHHYWILRVWISQGTKFHLKVTILIFSTKFSQRVSGQNWKKLNDLWTPYISNFYVPNLSFNDKICCKRVFPVKNRKSEHTTKFCIFKLVLLPILSLNWQFWFSGPNLPKKDISSLHQKKWTPPINFACSNQFKYQISV